MDATCFTAMSAPPTTPPTTLPPAVAPPSAGQPTATTAKSLRYAFSTGNAFAAFAKFNSKNYFVWRRKMVTQLQALGWWEVIDGTLTGPAPVNPANPTADEEWQLTSWRLRTSHAYAKIAL